MVLSLESIFYSSERDRINIGMMNIYNVFQQEIVVNMPKKEKKEKEEENNGHRLHMWLQDSRVVPLKLYVYSSISFNKPIIQFNAHDLHYKLARLDQISMKQQKGKVIITLIAKYFPPLIVHMQRHIGPFFVEINLYDISFYVYMLI